ncbi:MAG: hypothetical protein ABH914_02525 [Candidatus Omnitrophota bacterium]
MKRVITVLCCCVIGFIVICPGRYAFAQEKPVELTTTVARIPSARIIDWQGLLPTVNLGPGWQEQALNAGDTVCCPGGQAADKFVLVALNRPADRLVRLSSGTCLTIEEDAGDSADDVSQDSGEAIFDLGVLQTGSRFTVGTPGATIGVTGTVFRVIVEDLNADGDFNPFTLDSGDYTTVQVLNLGSGNTLTVDDEFPDAMLDPNTNPIPEYTLSPTHQVKVIIQAANVYTAGAITPASVDGSFIISCVGHMETMAEEASEKGVELAY